MTDMEIRDYAGMVDASPVETVVFEYRNRLKPAPATMARFRPQR